MERVRPGITLSEQAETYILEHKEMRRTKWNGRQIRNAFQTAVALAEYEQNPDGKKPRFIVSRKHFQTVVELSRKFEEYMEKTRGDDALNMEGGHVRAINSDEEENIKERPRKKQGGKKAVRDEDEE
jgi:hypothetical protein